MEVPSLEDRITSTIHTFMNTAEQISSSLAVIEHNTAEIFWWTSWAISIVLGLFILNLLVGIRAQLVELNAHQVVFRQMRTEDRANNERIRRERHMQDGRMHPRGPP
ncbi:hypothetical protein F4859DRAFT_64882 [Xylaria cf. heliscus]|nr:hypothetical protein F4859DRAFT_64882 [Xylaria cf. heliscus]